MYEYREEETPIEIELGDDKRRIFVKVYLDTCEIWIDTQGLPESAILCAMCDATPFLKCICGENDEHERFFVNIDWAINDWGGDKEIVLALKKRKQMIFNDLPRLREKYLKGNQCSATNQQTE